MCHVSCLLSLVYIGTEHRVLNSSEYRLDYRIVYLSCPVIRKRLLTVVTASFRWWGAQARQGTGERDRGRIDECTVCEYCEMRIIFGVILREVHAGSGVGRR